MIKLMASDLDGTLLLPDGSLPSEIFSLIEKMAARGILFTVASGRQYESLRRLFAPVADKVLFIAENGALVYYRGERLFCETLPAERLGDILRAVQTQKGAYPLLCCADGAYAAADDAAFIAECAKYYPCFTRVERLEDAPERDAVCKIAVYDRRGAAEFSGRNLPELLPALRVIVSGQVWTDISLPETNKGRAMMFVQKHFGLQREECAAFGDYMNDLEMLLACGHAYVPENGFPVLKEKIGNIIPSNAEKGVIGKIQEILGV